MKAGDEATVFLGSRIRGIYRVDKVTPTGLVKIGDVVFNKDGSRRGDNSWLSESIAPTTQEHRDELIRRRRVSEIEKTDFNKLTLDELSRIIDVIHESESKKIDAPTS